MSKGCVGGSRGSGTDCDGRSSVLGGVSSLSGSHLTLNLISRRRLRSSTHLSSTPVSVVGADGAQIDDVDDGAVVGASWVESKLQGSGGEPSIRVIKTLRCQRTLNSWRQFALLSLCPQHTHLLQPPRATDLPVHSPLAHPPRLLCSTRPRFSVVDPSRHPSSVEGARSQAIARFSSYPIEAVAHHHSLPRGPGKPLSTTPHSPAPFIFFSTQLPHFNAFSRQRPLSLGNFPVGPSVNTSLRPIFLARHLSQTPSSL